MGRLPSFSETSYRMVRKRLPDPKNESFLYLEWKFIAGTSGRSLRVNLEHAVNKTVHLVLGKAVSFRLSAPFYRNQVYVAEFLRTSPLQAQKRLVQSLLCQCEALHYISAFFKAGTSLVNPSSIAWLSSPWNDSWLVGSWPQILSTPSFEGAKIYIYASWFLRHSYSCFHLPVPFKQSSTMSLLSSRSSGRMWSVAPPVPSTKSVGRCHILLADR